MPKFSWATPPNSEVISALLLHFKPTFDPFFEKNCKGDPRPLWRCASKTWLFSTTCKNLGAQHPLGAKIWSSEEVDLGGYDSTSRSSQLVNQSSPDFFSPSRSSNSPILNIFIRFEDIRRRTLKSSELRPNFACLWPIKFFLGRPPWNFGPGS